MPIEHIVARTLSSLANSRSSLLARDTLPEYDVSLGLWARNTDGKFWIHHGENWFLSSALPRNSLQPRALSLFPGVSMYKGTGLTSKPNAADDDNRKNRNLFNHNPVKAWIPPPPLPPPLPMLWNKAKLRKSLSSQSMTPYEKFLDAFEKQQSPSKTPQLKLGIPRTEGEPSSASVVKFGSSRKKQQWHSTPSAIKKAPLDARRGALGRLP